MDTAVPDSLPWAVGDGSAAASVPALRRACYPAHASALTQLPPFNIICRFHCRGPHQHGTTCALSRLHLAARRQPPQCAPTAQITQLHIQRRAECVQEEVQYEEEWTAAVQEYLAAARETAPEPKPAPVPPQLQPQYHENAPPNTCALAMQSILQDVCKVRHGTIDFVSTWQLFEESACQAARLCFQAAESGPPAAPPRWPAACAAARTRGPRHAEPLERRGRPPAALPDGGVQRQHGPRGGRLHLDTAARGRRVRAHLHPRPHQEARAGVALLIIVFGSTTV